MACIWWIHAISALNDTSSFIHVGLVSNLREKGFVSACRSMHFCPKYAYSACNESYNHLPMITKQLCEIPCPTVTTCGNELQFPKVHSIAQCQAMKCPIPDVPTVQPSKKPGCF